MSAMSATLPSNGGHAFLQLDFQDDAPPARIEAAIRLVVPDWAAVHPMPWEIKLSSILLDPEALLQLAAKIDQWLDRPMDQLQAGVFVGTFQLAARRQGLRVSFGQGDGAISSRLTGKNIVSVNIDGGLQADCRFSIDVSCLKLFSDDLKPVTDWLLSRAG